MYLYIDIFIWNSQFYKIWNFKTLKFYVSFLFKGQK